MQRENSFLEEPDYQQALYSRINELIQFKIWQYEVEYYFNIV